MKVLIVIHGYPPFYMAGSEVYTYNLCRELAESSEVFVFTRIENPFEPPHSYEDTVEDGVYIRRVNNPERNYTLEDNYLNPSIDILFKEYLEYVKPDIVHIGHLSHLSTNIVEIAKEHNIPVILTLHDFWMLCFRGQLMTPENKICNGPSIKECMQCVKQKFKYAEDEDSFIAYRKHMESVLDLIDRFVAPSQHIKQYFINQGIPAEKVTYEKYGFDTSIITRREKHYSKESLVNFGFTGRVIPVKGVDLLIKSFVRIDRDNTYLSIYGSAGAAETFLKKYVNDRVVFKGSYHNQDIDRIFDQIDVLVVPSTWYEVSPLVIQEAYLAGVPVITTGIGGMDELVDEGIDGFKVPLNEGREIESIMARIADDPTILNRLKPSPNKVLRIEEHVKHILSMYEEVIRK